MLRYLRGAKRVLCRKAKPQNRCCRCCNPHAEKDLEKSRCCNPHAQKDLDEKPRSPRPRHVHKVKE